MNLSMGFKNSSIFQYVFTFAVSGVPRFSALGASKHHLKMIINTKSNEDLI
jgi:hypothetical protein